MTVILWFFWMGGSPWTFLAMPLLGAGYGAGLALLRPGSWAAGLGLFAPDMMLFAVDGSSPFSSGLGFVWCFHLAMLCLGMAVDATSTYDESQPKQERRYATIGLRRSWRQVPGTRHAIQGARPT